ncbi:MAG: GNAT family N-acetyltransferase [Actinomycetota bacterium]
MSPRPLERSDSHAAATALADAFAEDPAMCWAGGFDDGSTRLAPMWRAAIARRFRHPEPVMWVTDDIGAVALWDAPGYHAYTAGDALRSLPGIVRSFRWGVGRLVRLGNAMEAAHPSEPHYYLLAVGARRDRQGQGLGSTVLRPVLDRCDEEGVPAYLENSNPRNEPFYARHGFEARDPLDLPEGAPPIVPMWRAPR